MAMQESYLYAGIKMWAIVQENNAEVPLASLLESLLTLVQHIRFRLCTPQDVVKILKDPWLIQV